ncbi:MAG: TolC family protein [Gemmatimonadota bacterium]
MDVLPAAISSRSHLAFLLALLTGVGLGAPPGAGLLAQDAPDPDARDPVLTLSLDEAIRLAERQSPLLRQVRNDEDAAAWGLHAARGRFLPGANVSGGLQYQDGGSATRFGAFTGEDLGFEEVPPYYISDYSVGLTLSVSREMFAELDGARAETRAAVASTEAETAAVRQAVTASYLAVLRARDVVDLRRAELDRAEQTLELARARADVGAATPVETRQAEVARGRAEVELLRARAGHEDARLALIEAIGLETLPSGADSIRLTSGFRVFRPPWEEETLLRDALARQPRLGALQAREAAGEAAVDQARARYWPSLDLSAGWSGYTRQIGSDDYVVDQARDRVQEARLNCQSFNEIARRLADPLPTMDCEAEQYRFTTEMERQLLEANRVFPFDFTSQPFTVRLGVSIPIFQGFSRQAAVAQARAQAEDATEAVRAERLRLTTRVRSLLRRLRLEHRAARLEDENVEVAEAQLRLARERYRVGSARLLDLTEAEAIYAQAAQARLDAIYRFHETLAELELAVGRSLRDEAPPDAPDPPDPPDPPEAPESSLEDHGR